MKMAARVCLFIALAPALFLIGAVIAFYVFKILPSEATSFDMASFLATRAWLCLAPIAALGGRFTSNRAKWRAGVLTSTVLLSLWAATVAAALFIHF